jgi:hypothetical protein
MSEGHFGGQDGGLTPTDLVVQAWRMYRSTAPLLVPTFLIAFIILRELLLVVLIIDLPPIPLLLVATLVQSMIPAFAGSVLLAPAVSILATDRKKRLRDAWKDLAEVHRDIKRTASCSAGFALFAAITLGPVGIIVQPMILGPPLLIHEVVLHRRSLEGAWEHVKEMIQHDSRPLVMLLVIPACVGLLLSIAAHLRNPVRRRPGCGPRRRVLRHPGRDDGSSDPVRCSSDAALLSRPRLDAG